MDCSKNRNFPFVLLSPSDSSSSSSARRQSLKKRRGSPYSVSSRARIPTYADMNSIVLKDRNDPFSDSDSSQQDFTAEPMHMEALPSMHMGDTSPLSSSSSPSPSSSSTLSSPHDLASLYVTASNANRSSPLSSSVGRINKANASHINSFGGSAFSAFCHSQGTR